MTALGGDSDMKATKSLRAGIALCFILLAGIFITTAETAAQTKIMPVGNSITLGKVNNQVPVAGQEGYRKLLHEDLVNDGISVEFVGDFGETAFGHFADNAQIGWFHADSVMNIGPALATHQPDIVILHIGTNNIGIGQPVGNFNTPGTSINHLFTLVNTITSFASVDNLLLCKIIPKLSSPGEEVEVTDYNNAIEIMLNNLEAAQSNKVTLIDMWTPFYANQQTYYNMDVDKIHPNPDGYDAMATIFYHHISNILVPSFADNFDRAASALNGSNNWAAGNDIRIIDTGENGGGSVQFVGTDDFNWDNMAIWETSKNLTTIAVTIDASSVVDDTDKFGLAVGMDAVSATANGYLVWVYNGAIRIRTIVGGDANAGQDVTQWPLATLQPGDILQVSYRQADDANYFTFFVNNGAALTIRDLNRLAGNTDDLYSGLMFRGPGAGNPATNVFIDKFEVQSQLPDVIPPGRIFDFDFFASGNTSVTLTWTAPGNDDYTGTASSYDMRYSTDEIANETDFANATIVSGLSKPSEAGTVEIFTAGGLLAGTRYYFRIRAIDQWGNKGTLSDQVTIKTASAGQVEDSFDRATDPSGSIGDDWVIDPDYYDIDYNAGTEEGEFSAFRNDNQWGRVGVYRGIINPSMVKIVWGRNATLESIGQAGIALMLTRPDLAANGYLMFIETQWAKISLYDIQNGDVVGGGLIDQVPFTLKDQLGDLAYPGAGDSVSVVLDWNNDSGHRFDVFINGLPAADRALYDEDSRYNSTNKYSGLMLGGRNRTNNVSAFITLAEQGGAANIEAVAGNGQTGKVGAVLPDSLKVRIKDANNTPLSNIPVTFSVIEPNDATVSAPQPPDDNIRIEAEWGILSGTYSEKNDDPAASNERYVVAPAGDPRSGEAIYQFWVEKDTTYYFWARFISSDFWSSAIIIQIDTNEEIIWNTNEGNYGTTWQWDRVVNGGAPVALRLSRALHQIKFIKAHDNVPIDKILITPMSNYIPSGKEYVEQLMTDNDGVVGTTLTLGTTAGLNRVEARPFGTAETLEFTATGTPDVPVSMVKTNDNQAGVARDTLALPFIVTLRDQFGNLTPGIRTTFTPVLGAGMVTVPVDTTDENGQAQTFLIMGSGSATNTVQATFDGYTGSDVIFTATATSGLVDSIQALPGVGAGEKHFVNQVLPNFVKVQVFNDQNQLMDNVPVTFEIIEGDATTGKTQPKITDAQGVAQDTLYMGSTASVVKVRARIGAVTKEVATDSSFYRGARLSYYSGDRQTASISDTLYFQLKVRVFDDVNRPVAGHPVAFATQGNGFMFSDLSDSVVVLSNLSGIAATNVITAPIHGVYPDIVQAWSSDGFNMIPASPVKFTVFAQSEASRLIEVQGDSSEWVVRERLPDPLQVQMLNASGDPVDTQPVTFTIKKGGGQFEGTLMPTMTIFTDGDGYAQVSYTLGSEAGYMNNIIEASATNGVDALFGSPVVFHISATSSAADSIRAFSDQSVTGTVGKSLPQPVQVQITDMLGNPVTGESVTFSIISNSGGTLDTLNAVNGSADTTKTVFIDNALGIASITWTLGDTAGVSNNTLEARSTNGLINLKGSPVMFYASGEADVVSASRSTIEATGPIYATGNDTSEVTVTLLDAYGNPIAGKRVFLKVEGGTLNFLQQPIIPTDANGQAFGFLQSLSSGQKEIKADVLDLAMELDAVGIVDVWASNASRMIYYSGNSQTGNVGTVLRDSIVVQVTDDLGNPVKSAPVSFSVIGGGGRIFEPQPVVSDSNGLAWAHLILGANPGANMVQATSLGLSGSPQFFTATGEVGSPIAMYYKSGDDQIGDAGETLAEPFVVGVHDIDGDPVYGVDIVYEVDTGGGSLITGQPVKTNEWGLARAYFRADETSGTGSWVKAYNNSLSGSPIFFSVTSNSGPARRISAVSNVTFTGIIGETLINPIVVQVTDKFGNVVPNVNVHFNVIQGSAILGGNGPSITVQTNSSGLASTLVTLGNTAGETIIEATGSLLEGSPVRFSVFAQAIQAASIIKFMGDNQTGTVNKQFVDPLAVRVVDLTGNPVEGTAVNFVISDGPGTIIETQPVRSDSNGIAQIHFLAGSSPGNTIVTALWVNRVITFNLETVFNFNDPYLDKTIISATYDVFEGDEVLIPMVGSDADGDNLTFRIANLFPPEGATVEAQTPVTAVFRWTPGFDQQGTYQVVLQVIDNKGGSDETTVTINVQNTNRAPVIQAFVPTADTSLAANQKILFWVDARDADGDPLHYFWKVDGVTKGSDSPLFEYFIEKWYIGNMTVDVFVHDGFIPVSKTWNIGVTTVIEIAEFFARYDKRKMAVVVEWATSHERDNLGFDVYRSRTEDGQYEKVNNQIVSSHESRKYIFYDSSARVGTKYYYKIVSIDSQGVEADHGAVMVNIPIPKTVDLSQNYPNPFNPVTAIRYQIPEQDHVKLMIFNMMGQRIATLTDELQSAGYYVAEWDGRDENGNEVSTGLYIYQLKTSQETQTRRMIKIR